MPSLSLPRLPLRYRKLQKNIVLAPQPGEPHQEILALEKPTRSIRLITRKHARPGRQFGSNDSPAYGRGRDPDVGIIADALVFPGVIAGHYVEFPVSSANHRGVYTASPFLRKV